MRYDLPPERQTVMQQTAASSGQTAGGGAAPADARQAAAEAALRRAGAGGAGAEPASQQQRQRAALQQPFKKGDKVLYRQRDGSMEEATVGPAGAATGWCCIKGEGWGQEHGQQAATLELQALLHALRPRTDRRAECTH